jgi:hypothetical protein
MPIDDFIIEKDGDKFKTKFIPKEPDEVSNSTILNKLWNAYRAYLINNYGKNPDYFILHPTTAEDAVDELIKLYSHSFTGDLLTFHGVKIIRSFDIEINDIKAVGLSLK